jgi:hypothetical protein
LEYSGNLHPETQNLCHFKRKPFNALAIHSTFKARAQLHLLVAQCFSIATKVDTE